MAAPGKKSKQKWKSFDLTIENTRGRQTAGSGEITLKNDYDDYGGRRTDELVLPKAPRSSRAAEEDAKVPTTGPFYAYISNLAYELNEDELIDYFNHLNVNVKTVNLPKNEQSFKSRGFAHAEFEDRESLLTVLHYSHTDLKGRRMRVELAQNDGRGGMRGGMRNMNEPDYISQDWRAGGGRRDNDDDGYKSRRNYGDSGFGRRDGDRRGGFDREQRGGGFSRGDDERDWSRDSNTSWRDRAGSDRDRDRGGDRDRRGGGFGSRGFDDRRGGDRDRDDRRGGGELSWKRDTMPSSQEPSEDREEPRARPKLDLKPRSAAPVEKEEGGGGGGGEKASIFGGARPVDTASRERQIEERLEKQTALVDDPPRRKGPDSWERGRDRDRGYNKDGYRDSSRGGDRSRDRDRDRDERRSDDDYHEAEKEGERGGRPALAPAPPPSTNAWAARAAMAANQHSADNGRTSPPASDDDSKSGGGSSPPPQRQPPPQDSDAASRKYQPPRGRRPLPPSD